MNENNIGRSVHVCDPAAVRRTYPKPYNTRATFPLGQDPVIRQLLVFSEDRAGT